MLGIQLTEKDIIEKDFKTGLNGYKKEEVDEFLDIIIKDYEVFRMEVERLTLENTRLKKQLSDTKAADVSQELKSRVTVNPSSSQIGSATNYDILKRISNLEKAVFGNKLFE